MVLLDLQVLRRTVKRLHALQILRRLSELISPAAATGASSVHGTDDRDPLLSAKHIAT